MTTNNVLQYGMGTNAQRWSPLAQVNDQNVFKLTPAWSYSFGDEKQRGQESQAIVHDGVIYVTGSYSRVFALDTKTGKRLWTYNPADRPAARRHLGRGASLGVFAQGANLEGANLSGAYLEFGGFSRAKMHGGNLKGADLEMTWLSKADLKGANLADANLQEAKFGESNLENTDLRGTRQHYANFQDSNMEACKGCPDTWKRGVFERLWVSTVTVLIDGLYCQASPSACDRGRRTRLAIQTILPTR